MSTHHCIQIIWDYAMESMYCLWTFHYGLWCHIHAICPRPRLQDLPKWVQVRYHVGVGIGSEILMYKQHIALQEILSLRNRYTYLWSCLFWRRVKTLRIYERAAKTTTAIKIRQSGTSKTELERKTVTNLYILKTQLGRKYNKASLAHLKGWRCEKRVWKFNAAGKQKTESYTLTHLSWLMIVYRFLYVFAQLLVRCKGNFAHFKARFASAICGGKWPFSQYSFLLLLAVDNFILQ